MGLWSKYIAWVDADVRKNFGNRYTPAATVTLLPLVLSAPLTFYFWPEPPARYVALGVFSIPKIILLGIFIWRLTIESLRRNRNRAKRKSAAQPRAGKALD